mmetsp:Transcript_43706/g.132957  ORF Transcript_43706/g.132957 Transcript_43706/m.132957 type:complete len:365 (-) Transcript_43706:1408-2502(-)
MLQRPPSVHRRPPGTVRGGARLDQPHVERIVHDARAVRLDDLPIARTPRIVVVGLFDAPINLFLHDDLGPAAVAVIDEVQKTPRYASRGGTGRDVILPGRTVGGGAQIEHIEQFVRIADGRRMAVASGAILHGPIAIVVGEDRFDRGGDFAPGGDRHLDARIAAAAHGENEFDVTHVHASRGGGGGRDRDRRIVVEERTVVPEAIGGVRRTIFRPGALTNVVERYARLATARSVTAVLVVVVDLETARLRREGPIGGGRLETLGLETDAAVAVAGNATDVRAHRIVPHHSGLVEASRIEIGTGLGIAAQIEHGLVDAPGTVARIIGHPPIAAVFVESIPNLSGGQTSVVRRPEDPPSLIVVMSL